MKGWNLTRVWEIDEHLVVANTIEDAIDLFKCYVNQQNYDIRSVKRIGACYSDICTCAIIKEK